jgi:UV DNA damage endonuclease
MAAAATVTARRARSLGVRGFERLSPAARARLVLENDERVFDLADVLALTRAHGVPVVLDLLHHGSLTARHRRP